MKISKNNLIYLFSFVCIIFIFLTNQYFDEFNINPAASSSYYYLEIAKAFPNIVKFSNDSQSYIHAERFLISYTIGYLSLILEANIFDIFYFLSKIFIIVFILINIEIVKKFNLSLINSLILISLIFLNPYIIRYFLANPVMLNDLIFFNSISLLILSIQKKENILFYVSIILALISRQTAVVIIIALTLSNFFNFKIDFIDKKKTIISIFMLIFYSLFTKMYLNKANLFFFYSQNIIGIIQFIREQYDSEKILLFFLYPMISFAPLLFFTLTKIYKSKFKILKNTSTIFVILLILGIILQPSLGGPTVTGKNIIRLSTYSYIPIIYFFFNQNKLKDTKNRYFLIAFPLLMLWSFHPTFSIANVLYSHIKILGY
jgi:hypothetical protein